MNYLKKNKMSRLFEKFIEELFGGNPHLYDERKKIATEVKEQEMCHARQEWIDGVRTPLTHPISEWEALGKPNRKNQTLKCDSLNHIFGNPIEELDSIFNQTFKNN